MCVFVPYLPEDPLTDLRQTSWVYVGWPPICPWGVLFRKGQRVTFTFHYIIYAPASRHTTAKGTFCFAAAASKSLIRAKGTFCCTASRRVVGVCRWTSELPLRGSFSKRSTGRQVEGSTGHFFRHYIIYDSRRHHAEQSETTPLQKSTRRLLLARRVYFLVFHNTTSAVMNLCHVGNQDLMICKTEATVTHNLIGRKIIYKCQTLWYTLLSSYCSVCNSGLEWFGLSNILSA